jgi:hypothetical protein
LPAQRPRFPTSTVDSYTMQPARFGLHSSDEPFNGPQGLGQ